jgi:hypothetical protein
VASQGILEALVGAARTSEDWAAVEPLLLDETVGVHLAVMLEPFLTHILKGRKTIESRFAKNAIAPYSSIKSGDIVFMKAGPVVGYFRASSTDFLTLFEGDIDVVRTKHAEAICATDDEFWQARADKRYATLIGVAEPCRLSNVPVPKKDMRGWVVVRPSVSQPADDLFSLL